MTRSPRAPRPGGTMRDARKAREAARHAIPNAPHAEVTRTRHRARKRFGQHFLERPWADKLVAGLQVAPDDVFLEPTETFFFNIVNGRGWICVALVVFASWRPGKALLGALLFAFFDALQLRLQQSESALLPYQMYLMLPYALSILALVLVARRAAYPQALMKPYRKGER